MKIISKYKDYYDYLQGIYGQDEKLILDRSKGSSMNKSDIESLKDGKGINLAIMGLMFTMIYYQGKWYTERGLYNIGKQILHNSRRYSSGYNNQYIIKNVEIDSKTGLPKEFNPIREVALTNLNNVLDCPILKVYDEFTSTNAEEFPKLSDYNFGAVISPEDMWVNLYNWLSRVKEEPNTQTDKEKIVAAGFDLKTSFRNM